jgi:hypothetical protein
MYLVGVDEASTVAPASTDERHHHDRCTQLPSVVLPTATTSQVVTFPEAIPAHVLEVARQHFQLRTRPIARKSCSLLVASRSVVYF